MKCKSGKMILNEDEKRRDCIKYCLLKKQTNHQQDAVLKIAKALKQSDMSDDSIKDAILLLQALIK